MKACVLTGIRKMGWVEEPDPVLRGPHDVLLRMTAVGVCGSDVHYYVEGRVGSQVVTYPFAAGHEGAGVVERVGRRVKRVKVGDRVAIDPATPCWRCDQCRIGRHHTCRALKFLGCPGQAEGCLKERIVMPETSCFPVRRGVSDEEAALVEPLSIAVYSVRQSVPMKGARVAVLGSGPIGLSVLMVARRQGAARVYVTDKIPGRLALARRCGATWTGNPDEADVVATIQRREPLGLDAVLECCGQQDAVDQAFDLLGPGGRLVLVGIPRVERISFSIDKGRRKEISLQNIRRQVDCVEPALALITRRKVPAPRLITHRFPFERTQEAFEMVADYRDGVVKAVIEFPGPRG